MKMKMIICCMLGLLVGCADTENSSTVAAGDGDSDALVSESGDVETDSSETSNLQGEKPESDAGDESGSDPSAEGVDANNTDDSVAEDANLTGSEGDDTSAVDALEGEGDVEDASTAGDDGTGESKPEEDTTQDSEGDTKPEKDAAGGNSDSNAGGTGDEEDVQGEEDTQESDDIQKPEDVNSGDTQEAQTEGSGPFSLCSEALDCLFAACDSTDTTQCGAECFEGLNEDQMMLAEETFICASNACGDCQNSDDSACLLTCLFTNCSSSFPGCIRPVSNGVEGCGTGLGCMFDCTEGIPSGVSGQMGCFSNCFGLVSEADQEQLTNFGPCYATPQPGEFGSCVNKGQVCATSNSTGDNTCLETLKCIDSNFMMADGAGGPLPIFLCLGEATEEAGQSAFDTFLCTVEDSGGPGPGGTFLVQRSSFHAHLPVARAAAQI